jgi:hypothetical protein
MAETSLEPLKLLSDLRGPVAQQAADGCSAQGLESLLRRQPRDPGTISVLIELLFHHEVAG